MIFHFLAKPASSGVFKRVLPEDFCSRASGRDTTEDKGQFGTCSIVDEQLEAEAEGMKLQVAHDADGDSTSNINTAMKLRGNVSHKLDLQEQEVRLAEANRRNKLTGTRKGPMIREAGRLTGKAIESRQVELLTHVLSNRD